MKLPQIIAFPRGADRSVPKLNNQLALQIGYTRVPTLDPTAKEKASWFGPDGKEVYSIPDFTGSIDAAKTFLEMVAMVKAAGFVSRHGVYFAQVNDEPPFKDRHLRLLYAWLALFTNSQKKSNFYDI